MSTLPGAVARVKPRTTTSTSNVKKTSVAPTKTSSQSVRPSSTSNHVVAGSSESNIVSISTVVAEAAEAAEVVEDVSHSMQEESEEKKEETMTDHSSSSYTNGVSDMTTTAATSTAEEDDTMMRAFADELTHENQDSTPESNNPLLNVVKTSKSPISTHVKKGGLRGGLGGMVASSNSPSSMRDHLHSYLLYQIQVTLADVLLQKETNVKLPEISTFNFPNDPANSLLVFDQEFSDVLMRIQASHKYLNDIVKLGDHASFENILQHLGHIKQHWYILGKMPIKFPRESIVLQFIESCEHAIGQPLPSEHL